MNLMTNTGILILNFVQLIARYGAYMNVLPPLSQVFNPLLLGMIWLLDDQQNF
jgi:hypothetical protein